MSRILILAIVVLAGLFLMTVGFSSSGGQVDGDDAYLRHVLRDHNRRLVIALRPGHRTVALVFAQIRPV